MGAGCSGGQKVEPKKVPLNTTHTFKVKTGDKKKADTDGNIYISVRDEKGTWSEEKHVDTTCVNDFEVGATDVFHLELPGVGRVVEIKIRRDETCPDDAWYLEHVIVATVENLAQSVFPVHRWIHASSTLSLCEFDSCLPDKDLHPEQRCAELQKKRALYKLLQNIPDAPYQIESLPDDERFSNDYQWDIQSQKLKYFAMTKYIDLTTKEFKSLDDFKKVYKTDVFPIPYGAEKWKTDEEFGNQRLSGCNPIMLRLCQTIPQHLPVTDDMVKDFLEGKTLEACLEKKKIYMVDLRYMASIECTDGRALCGPTALFYSKDCGDLVPIAIQLMPEASAENPIFLPSDPEYTWLAAKMWFNLSDASHHQSVTHLGFTHLVMESVAVVTHRQLSPSHPIFKLIAPHFIYLIAINTLAVNKLVGEGGWVDKTMHIGRTGMFNIMKHNWAEWNLKDHGNLVNELKARGVDDCEALPNYHYRDDSLLLWNALERYVTAVVTQVYDTAEKLTGDLEIQAWAMELSKTNIKGMPESISTPAELAEILTCFIFIGSVGHAAANFCQYDEYAFPPNYPAMLRNQPPKDKTALTEDYIVSCLPDKDQVLSVMIVTKILSGRGTKPLADFEVQYAFDPVTLKALKELRDELNQITRTIDARNDARARPYPYLNPTEVPNAISI